jgi:uncharacterized protein (TIRG00374 family)
MRTYRNQFLIGLAFVGFVFVGILAIFNASEMVSKLDDFPLWLFVPILGLKFTNWVFRYWEWHYYLRVIGVDVGPGKPTTSLTDESPASLSLRDSLLIWIVGLPTAVSPGKIAELLKSIILKGMTGVSVSASAPVVFAERLVDGIAVILLVAISGIVVGDTFFDNSDISATYLQGVLALAIILMSLMIAILQFRSMANWLLQRWHHIPVLGRFQDPLVEFYESSFLVTRLRNVAPTVGMGMIGYTADGIIFYLILLGLGESGSWTALGQSIFILGFSVIVAALSAMPGGAGGRELTVGALLSAVMGISDAALGVTVLLVGFFQIWFGTILGIIVIIIFRNTLLSPRIREEIEGYEVRTVATPSPQ